MTLCFLSINSVRHSGRVLPGIHTPPTCFKLPFQEKRQQYVKEARLVSTSFSQYLCCRSEVCDSGPKPPTYHQKLLDEAAILVTHRSIHRLLSVAEAPESMITSINCGFHISSFTIILRYIFRSLRLFSGPRLYFPMSTILFFRATVQFLILCLASRLAGRCYGHMSIPAEKEELARKLEIGTWDRFGEIFGQTLGSAAGTQRHMCIFGVN